MTIQCVHAGQIAPAPWRNGGGSARTLLTWPDAAHPLVRVALADITQDGAFSDYTGMQRWFMPLRGNGVVLVHAHGRIALDGTSAPHEFDGADAPWCELPEGPVQDLSFMVPQAHGTAHMRALAEGEAVSDAGTWRGVFTSTAALLRCDDQAPLQLPPDTLAWSDAATPVRWCLHGGKEPLCAWWLVYRERAGR